ncbi:antitoxin [Streptomyces sp. NPDC059679]|uniref:antitoxin n=1 Tax=unclassified Streptomyces TaxID=2593676 RepID=UPI000B7E4A33|nr:antitoxin [Streptomyces sp. NBS 14/10]KAK1182588.1 antitoxin [Streptomyces sp. NBS 14/10]MDW6059498.1 antitoxin [Streptomyces sp. FXJ1.4098]NUS85517.1 antitoxin [Streptomyces sp.]
MSVLDNLKAKAGVMKDKAVGFTQQHEEKIERGLDKAVKTVDSKTKGKYRNKLETGADKAKNALGRFSHPQEGQGKAKGHRRPST